MKILFIGGTGRLSKDVAALACDQGNEIYLLTRGSNDRILYVKKQYHMIYCDIRDAIKSKQILGSYKFDVIIDFLTFNVKQLKQTLDIIKGKYTQYIFISTATVYKKYDDNEIISENVTSIGNDQWDYAFYKYQCEKYLIEYFPSSGGPTYTIIRPYVTYGNTRIPYPIVPLNPLNEWSFMQRIINHQPIPIFDDGKTLTTLTHTMDFAKGVVALLQNREAFREAFHVTSSEYTTWGTVLNIIEEVVGFEIRKVNFTQLEIYSVISEYKAILLGDKGTNMRFDNSKLSNAVESFTCDISLKDGIKGMIDFYNLHPELKRIDYSWNGKVDRLCLKKGIAYNYKYNFHGFSEVWNYYTGRYSFLGFINIIFSRFKRVFHKIKSGYYKMKLLLCL